MTGELKKTLGFVAAAAVLAILALITSPPTPSAAVFAEQGAAFYPEFKDPLTAASLEVVDFDESTASARPFKVALVGGKWVIPSHHNYPADAKDRLAKTAASVIDLKKDTVRSDSPKEHEELGVVDPLDEGNSPKGRGKRVTLKDTDGKVLADFIFGKETRDGSGVRYVRLPGQKRTYGVKAKADISTKFEDWIETDLLQLSQHQIRKVVFDNYSVDEQRGLIKDRAVFLLARDTSSDPWKMGEIKETEEVNSETMSQVLTALDDLKIVGVRPKPGFLTRDLKSSGDFTVKERATPEQMAAIQSLQQKGYFFAKMGEEFHIVSNEGEIQVSCEDGVIYTLRFGEVLVGEGAEVTAGDEKKDPKKKDDKKGGSENRYLFVTARLDESLLGAAPAAPPEVKADPARKPEEQKAEEEKAKKDKEEFEKKKKDYDKKIEDGKKRVKDLTDRFAEWYYVISADYFKKLRRPRAELVKVKEKKEEEKKPDEKKPEEKKEEKKEDPKPDEKKPDPAKPEEKKPEPKAEEKKPQ